MPLATTADLLDVLRHGSYLEPEQLTELTTQIAPRFPGVRELAKELVDRGWLTTWQINQLAKGKGDDLLLGQFVLLAPLGEGGMGQVFKARQRRLNRLTALKVVRKECLASSAAVQRFRREAQAAARLDHPNIVRVYDADEIKGTHVLAMEYIDGVDLSKLVKKEGPRPVTEACQYIRQAALGLQHAHERGMVHRDIKPSNLIRTRQGSVKILDMGLARLDQTAAESDAGPLTATGAVMGTPDYLAPEQARNARQVDIRADIYSLGCTLYYLLAGAPPFQSESLTEKLLQHQMDEPPAIDRVRPGMPPPLAAIIRRMMAKKPDDRYPTPAAVVEALAPFAAAGKNQEGIVSYVPSPVGATGASDTGLAGSPSDETQPFIKPEQRPVAQAHKRRIRLMAMVGAAVVLLVGIVSAIALFSSSSKSAGKTELVARGPETKPIPIHWPKAGEKFTNSIKMELVAVPPGKFMMGSDPKEPGHDDSEKQHPVEITRPFYMGKYEVSQEQYKEVMKRNPSIFQPSTPIAGWFVKDHDTDRFPVDNVSWSEAREFCDALSALPGEKSKKRKYRLPTEAEWEYACRAGTDTPYSTGKDLSRDAANYWAQGIRLPRVISTGKPNAFGLCDMHGNMQEWCQDFYAPYDTTVKQDPTGPRTGTSHVLRGGSFESPAGTCRSACRAATPANNFAQRFCGFRVVLEVND